MSNAGSEAPAALLRSYDSRKEPAPEVHCTIWEAGRATSATGLAFKEIQIGQSIFADKGYGKFNPAPQALDEAVLNEWPGREVGVLVSIGTGKRQASSSDHQQSWWEKMAGGRTREFLDARDRLLAKIEGCEQTHRYMLREHLKARNTALENYFRFNVEVGVGEFGMNEWNRLAEISTRTRIYLAKNDVQKISTEAANKMGRIHKAKIKWDRAVKNGHIDGWDSSQWRNSWESGTEAKREEPARYYVPPADPGAVELPGDFGPISQDWHPSGYQQYQNLYRPSIAEQKFTIIPDSDPNHPDNSLPQPVDPNDPDTLPGSQNPDRLPHFPQPSDPPHPPPRHPSHRYSRKDDVPTSAVSALSMQDRNSMTFQSPVSPRRNDDRTSPPPLPPKTPIEEGRRKQSESLPYPIEDGPPPVVNMARKPEFGVR